MVSIRIIMRRCMGIIELIIYSDKQLQYDRNEYTFFEVN